MWDNSAGLLMHFTPHADYSMVLQGVTSTGRLASQPVLADGKHRKAISFKADMHQFNVSKLLNLKGKTLRQPGPGVFALHKADASSRLSQLIQSALPSLRAVFRREEGTCACIPVLGTSSATGSLKHS